MYYTGIGSRNTLERTQKQMRQLAMFLAFSGYTLRSGKAEGADYAFQRGLEIVERSAPFRCSAEIYIPWKSFNKHLNNKWNITLDELDNTNEAESIVEDVHPAWDKCSQGANKLHTRNVYQVLGKGLYEPSDLLICYAEPTKTGVKGGTNTAWTLAKEHSVKCFNLWFEEEFERVVEFVNGRDK